MIHAENFHWKSWEVLHEFRGQNTVSYLPCNNVFQALKCGEPKIVNRAALKIKHTFTFIEHLEVSWLKCCLNVKYNYIYIFGKDCTTNTIFIFQKGYRIKALIICNHLRYQVTFVKEGVIALVSGLGSKWVITFCKPTFLLKFYIR